MDNKSKKFLALQKKWYEKIAKDKSYKDIEQLDGNLKVWSSLFVGQYNATLFEAKEQYYRLAGQFLHSHTFKDENEKLTWKLHSDGVCVRQIAAELIDRGQHTNKDAVNKVVRRLAKAMLKPNE